MPACRRAAKLERRFEKFLISPQDVPAPSQQGPRTDSRPQYDLEVVPLEIDRPLGSSSERWRPARN